MTTKLTMAQRRKIMAETGALKVHVTREGEVHLYVDRPRGDGGRVPWWMSYGCVDDLFREGGPLQP